MIQWNYRVFRENNGDYIFREVFYDEEGNIVGCTADAVELLGSSLDALQQELSDFQVALDLPVLTLADIPEAKNHEGQPRRANLSHDSVAAALGLDTSVKP